MMTHLLAMLLALQVAPPAIIPVDVLPKDKKPTYRTHSSATCGEWIASRAGASDESRIRLGVYKLWIQGYITGFNIAGPDTGDLLGVAPQEEFFTAVDGYCARNPSNFVVDAMYPIAAAFIRRRQGTVEANLSTSRSKTRAQAVAITTCRDWTRSRENAVMRLAYAGVIAGYVTAYNRFGPDPTGDAIGAADDPLIEEAVDRWCTGRSSALLIGAVTPLIDHVAKERTAGRIPSAGLRPSDKYTPGSPRGRSLVTSPVQQHANDRNGPKPVA